MLSFDTLGVRGILTYRVHKAKKVKNHWFRGAAKYLQNVVRVPRTKKGLEILARDAKLEPKKVWKYWPGMPKVFFTFYTIVANESDQLCS